uniref:Uncharacterized protein n=1 Tax=Ciona savignyi TaxID=51511 RepID=H2ZDJ7_CIOSA
HGKQHQSSEAIHDRDEVFRSLLREHEPPLVSDRSKYFEDEEANEEERAVLAYIGTKESWCSLSWVCTAQIQS